MKEVAPSLDDEIPEVHDTLEPNNLPTWISPTRESKIGIVRLFNNLKRMVLHKAPQGRERSQIHFLVMWI